MPQTVVLAVKDSNILYLLRRYVEESGLAAVSTSGNEDLLEAVTQARPVLVIADAVGHQAASEALQSLRERPDTQHIPVLLYGSDASHPVGKGASTGPQAAIGYLQDYLMYDQFVAALRQVGVLPRQEVARI
jgi:CheY-like chemotaxis protein